MDGVPREIQMMMLLERSGAPGGGSRQIGRAQVRHSIEAKAGRTEPWDARGFRQTRYLARIFERGCERLVNEQRFAGCDHGAGLRQMHAAVDAGEQNGIHLPAELLNTRDDLDVPFVLQLLRESLDAVAAGVDIRTSAFVRGHDACAGYMVGRRGVVQELGEGGDVGSVGPDDAQAEVGR